SEAITNVGIAGQSTGAIDITVVGGVGPYNYSWTTSDGSGLVAADEDQTGLSAGTYAVTITDANGCTISDSYTVTEPGALTVSGSLTQLLCNGDNNGAIDITVVGGVGPYNYSW
ncbi:adhesin, partial [Aureibaculum marinum]